MIATVQHPVIFVHGKESSSRGTKGAFFRDRFPEMIIPDFAGDVAIRMASLHKILRDKSGIIMVGSSLGGLMAALYAFQHRDTVKKLILLAPALSRAEFTPYQSETISIPVFIFHGSEDEVIPPEPIQAIAEKVFTHVTFTLVDDDHRLSKTFTSMDWPRLLAD